MIDITGQRSGMLTAVKEVDPWILPDGRKQRQYECKCDCGNTCIVRVNDFRSGKSTSCGCKRKQTIHEVKLEDLTGQKFGRLTVLENIGHDKRGRGLWKCICECGNIIECASDRLKSGNTKSCGCYKSDVTSKRSFKDLTGQTFGHLKVLSFAYMKGKFSYYNCMCDCGTPCVVSAQNLRRGHTSSCGHICSVMEDTVNQYLLTNHYNYTYHKTFNNLKRYNYLEFDFAINDDNNNLICLIECQGEQHYKNVGSFGELQRNYTDEMKRKYCNDNNIPLFEIKFSEEIIPKLQEILQQMHVNPVPSLEDEEGQTTI